MKFEAPSDSLIWREHRAVQRGEKKMASYNISLKSSHTCSVVLKNEEILSFREPNSLLADFFYQPLPPYISRPTWRSPFAIERESGSRRTHR